MSLDTVLKIGKALRASEDSLKNFKYVRPCPKDKDGFYSPTCISLPVEDNYRIDWNGAKLLPENEKPLLYYLTFKTSDGDSSVKYIFGDIFYGIRAKLKKNGSIDKQEIGYYKLGNPDGKPAQQKGSFERGQSTFEELKKSCTSELLSEFRKNLSDDLEVLEKILVNISGVEGFFYEKPASSFLELLNNDVALSDLAIKRIYDKTSPQALKKLGINSEFHNLTKEERNKLLSFDNGELFIHFEFPENLHWYQHPKEFSLIVDKMLSDFADHSRNGIVLKKTLYKTLCSGDKKNDWQFPAFTLLNKHKSKSFTNEEFRDLFYAIDFCSKGRTISGTDIKIILLPQGKDLTASDFEEFINNRDEERINKRNRKESSEEEPLFDFFEKDNEEQITSFDVIFCKMGGTSAPDIDLLEISGIEKSKIRITKKRLEKISGEVAEKRKEYLKTKQYHPFKLEASFRYILGDPQFDQKTNKVLIKASPRYKSHILKVLPRIYTDNYHQDNALLPAFIQNIEYSIRAGDSKLFKLLRFDLEYLFKIQNSKTNAYMKIINSESYQMGLLLGSLAKGLAMEIKSFEKNYVGNLTRRISTIDDFIKLKNDIEQKLIMHEKSKFTFKTSYDLAQQVKGFKGRYDKEECAFGFFESYFKPIAKKGESTENN
jgi:hypothetical protein